MGVTTIRPTVPGGASQAMDSGVWRNASVVRRCPTVVYWLEKQGSGCYYDVVLYHCCGLMAVIQWRLVSSDEVGWVVGAVQSPWAGEFQGVAFILVI
jgi:hypothetical protein